MIPTWLTVILISIPCGFAFGLTQCSSAEASKKAPGFMLFGTGSFSQLLASGIVNAILNVVLFLGPSGILLNVFDLVPLCGYDYYVWVFSLLGGVAIGKTLRWWRWRRTCDFV